MSLHGLIDDPIKKGRDPLEHLLPRERNILQMQPLEEREKGKLPTKNKINAPSPLSLDAFAAERPAQDEERRGRVQTALLVALGVGGIGALAGGGLGDSLLALGAGGASGASEMLGGLDEEYIEQMDAYRSGIQELIQDQQKEEARVRRDEEGRTHSIAMQEGRQAATLEAQRVSDAEARAASRTTDAREDSDDLIDVLERSGDVQGLANEYMRVNPSLPAQVAFDSAQATVNKFATDTRNRERLASGPRGRSAGGRGRSRSTSSSGVSSVNTETGLNPEFEDLSDTTVAALIRNGREDLENGDIVPNGRAHRRLQALEVDGQARQRRIQEGQTAQTNERIALESASRFWDEWQANGFSDEWYDSALDRLEDQVDVGRYPREALDRMLEIIEEKQGGF